MILTAIQHTAEMSFERLDLLVEKFEAYFNKTKCGLGFPSRC